MTVVVVTGGTGLLGRAVLERLAGRVELVALHRPGTEPPAINGVTWIAHDLTVPFARRLPARFDGVLHLAQSRRHRNFPEGAVDTFEVNAAATVRLLDACRRAGGRSFVYASSGAVYGPGPAPLRETDELAPPSFYGETKLAAERAVAAFSDYFSTQVLRFFLVHGSRQEDAAFIPGLAARVRSGRPIDLRGPDGMRCNPIHVDEAAAAVEAAWQRAGNDVINVAGAEVVTLRQIGELIGRLVGRTPRFAVHPPSGDLVADVERMRRLLVEPRLGVAEGLARTLRPSRAPS